MFWNIFSSLVRLSGRMICTPVLRQTLSLSHWYRFSTLRTRRNRGNEEQVVNEFVIVINDECVSNAYLKKITAGHLAQPIDNHMRCFSKPLQESMFSPALARGWLHQNMRETLREWWNKSAWNCDRNKKDCGASVVNQSKEGAIKPRTLVKRRAFAQVVKRVIPNPYLIGSFLKFQLRNTWKRWNKSSHNTLTKCYSPITWIVSSKWWLRKNQKRGCMLCNHVAIRIFHGLRRVPSTCGEIRKAHSNTCSANTMAKHSSVRRSHNHRTCKALQGPKHRRLFVADACPNTVAWPLILSHNRLVDRQYSESHVSAASDI
jgi:hypothetical protein